MTTDNKKNNTNEPDTGHVYDGIRELDHDLPRWWLWLFYLTIIWSVPYFAYYHLFNVPGLSRQHDLEVRQQLLAELAKPKAPPVFEDSKILAVSQEASARDQGKATFVAKCASCHGAAGQGGIGPNLTDEYWLHGGKPSLIAKVIDQGVLDKGMPSWRSMMSPEEILTVSAYVQSIRGTRPPGAKAPQGNLEKQ